jgi:methyl-accepting chemotaxis protein
MFKSSSIKLKISLGYLFSILVFIIIGFFTFLQLESLNKVTNEFYENSQHISQSLKGLKSNLDNSNNIDSKFSDSLDSSIVKLDKDTKSFHDKIQSSQDSIITNLIIFIVVTIVILLFIMSFSISSISKSLSSALNTLVKVGKDMTNISSNVSTATKLLTNNTSNQAASVEEISATVEQTSSAIIESENNINDATQLTNDTNGIANIGNEKIKRLLENMDNINGSSKEISNIIKTIDEIAFQTNLLALNAAVEAARAGEHGLGFAVVAEEVRALAGRSASAAKETTQIIEKSIKEVQSGMDRANDTNESFEQIVEHITQVNSLMNSISVSSSEQSNSVQQISSAMQNIDSNTNSLASESLTLNDSAIKLTSQAKLLEDSIDIIKSIIDGGSSNSSYSNVNLSSNSIKEEKPKEKKSFFSRKDDTKTKVKDRLKKSKKSLKIKNMMKMIFLKVLQKHQQ